MSSLPSSAVSVSTSSLHHALVEGQHEHGASGAKEEATNIELTCKWKTNTYELAIPHSGTIGLLKTQIALLTDVRTFHQKLIIPKATKVTDDQLVSTFVKPGVKWKLSMIGNPEEELFQDDGDKGSDVVDDLDYDYRDRAAELLALQTNPAVRKKMEAAWQATKDTFTLINPARAGKKLLVLDLDYTLFDMHGNQEESNWRNLRRPYTHRFLTACYEQWDIVVWSQTSWRHLELKLTQLGILTHPAYRICFVLDKGSMFSIESPQTDGQLRKHHVKPLELIWRKFPQWTASNTVHVDDLARNFALNLQSGLRITAYKDSHQTRATDGELKPLARYLLDIAKLGDLSKLDHSQWKKKLIEAAPRV